MSKRKGVSAEEKRTRMLQLFYEKREFFQLKELEKIAPKEKGIVLQSVKDVLQSLVDDGLVDSDKIGTSIYYWAYPSKSKQIRKRKFEELNEQLQESNKRYKRNQENLSSAKVGRENSNEREKLLEELSELRNERNILIKKIQQYKDSDPEVIEQMQEEIKTCTTAANRWTDNIFAVKSWCKNKFFMEESLIDKQFGIPEDFDYLDN